MAAAVQPNSLGNTRKSSYKTSRNKWPPHLVHSYSVVIDIEPLGMITKSKIIPEDSPCPPDDVVKLEPIEDKKEQGTNCATSEDDDELIADEEEDDEEDAKQEEEEKPSVEVLGSKIPYQGFNAMILSSSSH